MANPAFKTHVPLLVCLLLLASCESAPSYPSRTHVLHPITADRLPGGMSVPAEATFATWKADASRLAVDIERSVKRAEWGLLEVIPGTPAKPPHEKPVRAEALLPDNRVAVIYGWALSETEVAAAVVVGRFGDAAVQRHFLQVLADTLADKPKPKRGGKFELP